MTTFLLVLALVFGSLASPTLAGPARQPGGLVPPTCGDGQVNGGEFCDDGNDVDWDGCDSDCTPSLILRVDRGVTPGGVRLEWEGGFAGFAVHRSALPSTTAEGSNRTGVTATRVWTEVPPAGTLTCYLVFSLCGNGIPDAGEECDDGNNYGLDGCRSNCTAERCGDGIVDPGEGCDDGNLDETDGCRSDCTVSTCGDGTVDEGEECDDGNLVDGDGCQAGCVLPVCGDGIRDPGEGCDLGAANSNAPDAACRPDCGPRRCGDGVSDSDEECDDGNAVNGDGCQATCLLPACGDGIEDSGEVCDLGGANSNVPDAACRTDCTPQRCGDDVQDTGEECDDGNVVGGDGCQANCLLPVCGDGIEDSGEGCDLGEANSDDPDAECRTDCSPRRCGDGVLDTGESCDDGNAVGGDGCQADCLLPVCGDGAQDTGEDCDLGGANSNAPNAPCRLDCSLRRCGDGVQDTGEACDDGNDIAGDSCKNDCTLAFCGDGIVNVGVEECDDGNGAANDSCRPGCIAARCGDGILRTGVETCDDGNAIDGDTCSTRCRTNVLVNGNFTAKTSWTFTSDGTASWNTVNNEAVLTITTQGTNVQLYQTNVAVTGSKAYRLFFRGSASGGQNAEVRLQKHTAPNTAYGLQQVVDLTTVESQFSVPFTTTAGNKTDGRFMFWFAPYDTNGMTYRLKGVCLELEGRCGDAIVDPGETCDDGNTTNADGCQATCQLAACGDDVLDAGEECDDGNTGDADGCQGDCRLPFCGDGIRDPGEECDDGNNEPGDRCRPDCTDTCGDAILDPGEDCDLGPGNSEAPDATCRTDCTPRRCGDGVIDSGETCDDGNVEEFDGCSPVCLIEPIVCGNGRVQPGEQCDDGNTDPSDGCEPDCRTQVPGYFRQPRPGEIYREYTRVMTGENWRVTDPGATATGSPGNSPADFLPNPMLALTIGDLQHAVRAEVLLDVWGGHVGTTMKKLRFNGNPYIDVPELTTTPTAGQCFVQQWNIVLDVPLGQLIEGSNIVEGTSGAQSCHGFNWGQWGWYGMTVRVYYGPEKAHPTGNITAPASGVTLPANPTIAVSAHGPQGIAQVDFLAYYEDVDFDGDGRYTEYHGAYHRTLNGTTLPLTRHVGSAVGAPYRVTWNTLWVPDQTPGRIRILARIKGGDGLWYVTPEVTDISLARPGTSVRLYKPTGVPQNFWVRDGQAKSATLTIPAGHDLVTAQAARLVIPTWNGIDGAAEPGQLHYTRLNNWVAPNHGANHFYKLDELTVPVAELLSGANTFTVQSDNTHHGIEVLWPGPQLLVRYSAAAGPCGNGTVDPTETCDDGNVVAGDGCGATCLLETCGDGLAQTSRGEQCDDGNVVSGDGCSSGCLDETCGDGDLDAGEACDDGNAVSGDGCSSVCVIEYCGDGRVQLGLGETCDAQTASTWKEPTRGFRVSLQVSAGGFVRNDAVAEASLNLQTLLTAAGGEGTARKSSLMLFEVDAAGVVVDSSVPFQFDGTTNGRLVWILEGATSAMAMRRYELYFDTANFTPPTFPDQVGVTDGVEHDGQTAFSIQNDAGTFYFQKEAAGFSGLVDIQGNDWLSYSTANGTAGEFRGIPNLVFPANIFHPGFTSASSTLLNDGPIKATIDSPSDDLTFKTRWEFYPDFARLTVQQATGTYWFLYEGTPGGLLDRTPPNDDRVVRSDGTVYSAGQTWPGGQDIPGDEWVYFSDPLKARSLFLAHHTNDSVIDWYEPLDVPSGGPDSDWMTVFGFGRGTLGSSWLSGYGRQFTIGLLETTEFGAAEAAIRSAYKPVPVTVGASEPREALTECTANCRLIGCGDGTVAGGEECDDGNLASGDGCDADCVTEACGNGILQAGEECDDGNTNSGDGCSAICVVEGDCGNGTLEVGELCDDGNTVSGDGCSATCKRFRSDDFDHDVLPSHWSFVNPRGDASYYLSGHNTSDAWLNIVVPGGVSHDAWTPSNAPRLMHGADNGDFVLETRIESAVVAQHQFQGILVEQDGSNWLRFDVLSDGSKWRVFAARVVGGVATQLHSVALTAPPSPQPLWLRVTRVGDTWTEEYSLDGSIWTLADSNFVQALTVQKVGLFAGNASNNVGFTARFDYLFDPANPMVPEDGIACGNNSVEDGETCDDGNTMDGDGCTATCQAEASCGDGLVAGGELCDDGNTVGGDGCTADCRTITSDDFSAATLDGSLWTVLDPLGGSTVSVVGTGTAAAALEIGVAGGVTHDAWLPNNAVRVMQVADNSNFDVEVRLESPLWKAKTFQGIFVEESETAWIRFDVVSDGSTWHAEAIRRTGGTPSVIRDVTLGAVPSPGLLFLRVTRVGSSWTYRYSTDGTAWTDVGASFSVTLAVQSVGVLAGNAVGNPAFTARFDYFFKVAAPSVPEDPSPCGNGSVEPGEACDAGGANSDLPGAACRVDCRLGGCGDGILDPGETCDAAIHNAEVPGAPCRSDCTAAGCGDGVLDPGEVCDDGPANSEAPGATCRTDCAPAGCGDGVTDPGEQCDLGAANSNAPDAACRLDCETAGCGDGVVDSGEACDDGNVSDGDGCSSVCVLESDCGNGVLDAGERCDDGNTANGDGCSSTCRTIVSDDFSAATLDGSLWTVSDPLGGSSVSVVGTGTAAAALEIDVAGAVAHDAWLPNNAVRVMQAADNSNFDIQVRLESPLWQAKTFQGIFVEESETAWIRFDVVSDGSTWHAEAIRRTGGTPSVIRDVTLGAVPSPGLLFLRVTRVGHSWTYRYSTDGTTWTDVGASFSVTLAVQSVGVLAGNAVNNPAFTARFDYFFKVTAPIVPEDPSACGNGTADGGEDCDAGGANSDLPGAACRTDCRLGGCGDGILDPGEVCDAAGHNADTSGAPCRSGCTAVACGDGIVDPGEVCDLGGANSNSPGASCRLNCQPAGCGDGITDPGEQCDDGAGNSNAPDAACRLGCTAAGCGDGIKDTGEECDDGNVADADGCSAACLLETPCGNAVLDSGELCDDGNTIEGDGCSNACEKIVSDDFSAAALNTAVWTTVNPLADASFAVTGTGTSDARLEVSVAGAVTHDAWVPNNAARVMQAADNSNFDVIVKMETTLDTGNKIQGIFVEESANDWIRLDIYSNGTKYKGFVARRTAGGTPAILRNVDLANVPSPVPLWLRVTRTGNAWLYRYSLDGTAWTTIHSFNSTLVVANVGVLAGNAAASPAFTARFDYFFDAAAPIAPEDP